MTLGAVLLASCGSAPQPVASEPTIAPPPQTEAGLPGGDRNVVGAYERFWVVSRGLPHRPAGRWRPELEQVAAGPMAETVLNNLARQQEQGITLYGEIHPRITDVHVDGPRAVVTDCQDGSRSGQADAASGKPRTVGVARNAVSGTVERGPDGTWRVTRVDYPEGGC